MMSDADETEAFIRELDLELEIEVDEVEADEPTQHEDAADTFVVAHNGMSEDMQEVDALYIIETANRAAHIHVTWDVSAPKTPKLIQIEYLTDDDSIKRRRIESVRKFRGDLASGDYCKRDMELGLVRLRGWQKLHAPGGVVENIYGTLGRHAAAIVSFLEGGDMYLQHDLSYDNSWGTW